MCRFNHNPKHSKTARYGFTIVEVGAALVLLSMLLGSVMVLMNRYVDAVMDMRLRQEAFELARSNMETLLTENRLSDTAEFGTSEINPAIEWSTIVEPFYEPATNRMWVRAVCTTEFLDTQGEYQLVELEHWITNLTAAQVKQVVAQQQAEDEYMKLLETDELTDIEETTLAFMKEEGLDVEGYNEFRKKQRRKKIKYLSEKGTDGWDDFLETLEEEENEFLEKMGMNFDRYNDFARVYVPRGIGNNSSQPNMEGPFDPSSPLDDNRDPASDNNEPDSPSKPDDPAQDDGIPWDQIPRDFWPLFKQLGFNPPE